MPPKKSSTLAKSNSLSPGIFSCIALAVGRCIFAMATYKRARIGSPRKVSRKSPLLFFEAMPVQYSVPKTTGR